MPLLSDIARERKPRRFTDPLEAVGLNQRRTSPRDHLVCFTEVPWAGTREVWQVGGLAQWGIFTKAPA